MPRCRQDSASKRCFIPILFLVCTLGAQAASAELVRVEVNKRQTVAGGKHFGNVGAYEAISGKLYFAVDPTLDANRIITDIELAPTGSDSRVQFSADFHVIKPKEMARANRTLLLEVSNRGGKSMLGYFNFAERALDPTASEHFGDGFLQEQGYTLLWVGWQWDTPEVPGRIRMHVPTARSADGEPVRGVVRADFVVKENTSHHSLADRNHIPYAAASMASGEASLSVRTRIEDDRTDIERKEWGFGRVIDGKVVSDPGYVYLKGGFEPNRIYEVVYISEDPPLVGLGPTGIRDAVVGIKDATSASVQDTLQIRPGDLTRAVGFGISQSGRFLRTFLYYGFNRSEKNTRAFDGIIADVAGGGRGSFNHRFAQASRDAHPYLNFFHPTDIFPFSDISQKDPETGVEDGLLSHQGADHLPKIFYTNSSYEYWGRSASLIHTSVDGQRDVNIPDHVRVYLFAGTQHGPGRFPPQLTNGVHPANPMNFRWSMRALLESMHDWMHRDIAAPESRYPRHADNSIAQPEKLNFPAIPGVHSSTRIHRAYRADYGDRFRTDGIVSKEPPEIGTAFPQLVPAVDSDGNEIAGIRLPEHQVPLATYTGWNLFHENHGPVDELASMTGSYFPFANSEVERKKNGDPRPSILKRYGDREHYLGLVALSTIELVEERYLLRQDMPALVDQAARHWDFLMAGSDNETTSHE